MLVLALLLAQSQPLPAELETVTLRITAIEDAQRRTVYVVTSEQFDNTQPARVQTLRAKGNVLKGEHMQKIAAAVARDQQRVFVLARVHAPVDVHASLRSAGINDLPLIAGR